MIFALRRPRALLPAALWIALACGTATAAAGAPEPTFGHRSATSPAPADDAATPLSTRFESRPVVQPLPDPAPAQAVPEAASAVAPASLRALVEATAAPDALTPELACLASAVYHEARGEPLTGQLAVARVVMNRAASPLFPDSYCAVVTQPGQFSFVRGGRLPAAPRASAAWRQAQAIALIAAGGLWASEADDALYFHATHVRPRWAGRKIARATIERHVFYR